MNAHLLAFLVSFPIACAAIVACIPRRVVTIVKPLAAIATLVELAVSAKYLLGAEYVLGRASFSESYGWVWDSGLSLALSVDGLSMPLVMLTTAVAPLALLVGYPEQRSRMKSWAVGMLVMEAALVGAFVARDLVVFYVCWELVLLPLYVFVAVWGSGGKSLTANRFFLFTLAGSLLMLVAILYVGGEYAAHSPRPSFLVDDLVRLTMPLHPQALCYAAFAIAFLIKMPVFPFHAWSPETYRDAPLGAVLVAAGVMAKLGSYGLVRFAGPLFPLGAQYLGPTLAVFAVVSILYGAFVAIKQDDARMMLAYSSMSHMGFVALGIFALTPAALSGSIFQMVSHGITTVGMFLVVDAVERRTGTRSIAALSGVASVAPRLGTAFVMIALATVAIPTTSGFVGETMILSGVFGSDNQAGFGAYGRFFAASASLGVVFGALYILSLVQKVVWGEANEKTKSLTDLGNAELAGIVPLVALAFGLGLAPSLVLDAVVPAAEAATLSFDMRWGASRATETTNVLPPAAPTEAEGDEATEPTDAPVPSGSGQAVHAPRGTAQPMMRQAPPANADSANDAHAPEGDAP